MTGSVTKPYLSFLFFLVGILCIILCLHAPVKDFGNYYYGSKLWLDGKFSAEMYTSISYFNKQIASYGETRFFENYIPVPPFNAIFYTPFCLLKSLHAKLLFNLISLLLLCVSIERLQKKLKFHSWLLYLLPFIFFYPVYNNILQGQSYILITALLIEAFISTENKRILYPSILIGVSISLKIFPFILILYFILKKNYRMVTGILCSVLGFFLITLYALPKETTQYYHTDVLPRLFNNDVVGAYYHGNQSVYTALLTAFSFDALSNSHPVIDSPFLVVVFESLFFACVLAFLISIRKKDPFLVYALVVFATILLGRYTTSYGMMLLLPLALAFLIEKNKSWQLICLFILIAITVSLPVGSFAHLSFIWKFSRLWGLLLILLSIMFVCRIRPDLKSFVFILLPVFVFKYFSYPVKPADYFNLQNTKGILYDLRLNGDSLTLVSTLGEKEFVETYPLDKKADTTDLIIKDNNIYYKGSLICESKDNKRKAFKINDSSVVFMSDLNQAVRFYKLRKLPLKKP